MPRNASSTWLLAPGPGRQVDEPRRRAPPLPFRNNRVLYPGHGRTVSSL